MRKTSVLFLCTQNSARSQMAEAFLRHHGGEGYEAYSAGCAPTEEVHPYAVEAMREVGIDISDHHPKGLKIYMGKVGFNYSIIVCRRGEEDCPKAFPGAGALVVWPFDDPRGPHVPEDEMLDKFREVRDEIEEQIVDWLRHPEAELERLKAERESRRRARMLAEASDRRDREA